MPAASWYTPAAPILAVPGGPPWGFTACTFAWSYRYAAGQLDSPPTARMLDTDMFSSVFINGHNDSSGRSVAAGLLSSGWASADFDFVGPTPHLVFPGGTNNFVLRFSAAGFGGGIYAQLWHNGTLVMTSNDPISDASFAGAYFMGDRTGALQIPGETQGYWWSNDTAVDPATLFADLFDGANGLRDLNADPTIGGVYPDAFHMEPGAGGGGGVVTGTVAVTGTASGTVRASGTVAGTVGVTGSASGTVRAAATVSGVVGVTGAASGSVRNRGTVSGVVGVTGSATGQVRASGAVSGAVGVSGAASGSVRATATVSGTIGVTGSASGSVSGGAGIVSGTVDVTGQAAGSVRVSGSVAGVVGVTGTASGTVRATGTVAGNVEVSGSAAGEVSSGSVTGEVAGVVDVTGHAEGLVRVYAAVSGLVVVTGFAADSNEPPRNITVPGMWLQNVEPGIWRAPVLSGAWRNNIVKGKWRDHRSI